MKERIIGAIVLVAVVVLVVPVFLDGPPGDSEIRSERVPLPGQDEHKTQTVVLDRNRTEPVPATAEAEPQPRPQAVERQTDPVAETREEPVKQPPAETPAEPPVTTAEAEPEPEAAAPQTQDKPPTAAVKVSSTGMFAVQLGSFSSKQNAEKLAADLRKQGFAAFLSQLATDGGQLQRVRVGPQKDRQSAEEMAARLAKAGHKGQVVPHP